MRIENHELNRNLVWLVSPYETPSGFGYRESRWEILSERLIRNGINVKCIISDFCHIKKVYRKLPIIKNSNGVYYISLNTIDYRGHVSFRRLLAELHFAIKLLFLYYRERTRPNLIITKEPPIFVGMAVLLIKKLSGTNYIVDVIDLWPELHIKMFPRLYSKALGPLWLVWKHIRNIILNNADQVVVYANEMCSIVPITKSPIIVYNTINQQSVFQIDTNRDKLLEEIKSIKATKFVYTGTLGENYDLTCVINAFKQHSKLDLEAVLLIFGSGPREEEFRTAAASSPERIKIFGRVPFAWLATILENCDVGLLPYSASSTVTLPDKFYDYSNVGIPMITSIKGEVGQIIKENGIGELYEPGSVESLSFALTRMTGKANLGKYRENSKKTRSKFSVDTQFQKYVETISKVLLENIENTKT